MKLVTFTQSGKQSYGFVDNDTITDIGQTLASTHPDLKSLNGDEYAKLISSTPRETSSSPTSALLTSCSNSVSFQ